MLRDQLIATGVIVASLGLGCSSNLETTRDEILARIKTELPVGASKEEVEAFLDASGHSFSWDPYQMRYALGVMDRESDSSALVIHLYLNKEMKFERAQGQIHYTSW